MAGLPFGIPTTEQSYSSTSLDHSRLTCEEYVAFITVQVVQNMDAIAWARVNRKTRMPELVQHLQALNEGRSAREMDYDDNDSYMMETPGLLRKVCFPFKDLKTAFSYAEDLGRSCSAFAETFHAFFSTQQLTFAREPFLPKTLKAKLVGLNATRL